MDESVIKRLNWGCGSWTEPGWINADIKDEPGVDISCDILDGLPLDSNDLDYAVSIHSLPEIPYPDLVPALEELRRVLKPGGVLRLSLPDMEKAIAAYQRNDRDYFLIPDEDVTSIGGKMIVQLTWYGYSRSLFTFDYIEELLYKAGFTSVTRCAYQQTNNRYPEIVELDNREQESLFVEAVK
jgi:SAM-dependent methyltransferase